MFAKQSIIISKKQVYNNKQVLQTNLKVNYLISNQTMFNPFQEILQQHLQVQIDQDIEADIERLLEDDGEEVNAMERELAQLRRMREQKRQLINKQMMLFANESVELAESPQHQLVITIKQRTQSNNNTSQLYTRILQLQQQNTLLQLQVQSFTRQKRLSSLNQATVQSHSFSSHSNQYEMKINQLQQKIIALEKEMLQLQRVNGEMQGRLQQMEKYSKYGQQAMINKVRLLEIPLELLIQHNDQQSHTPQIIQKQVLVQVPVPIYVKTYKSAIFPKSVSTMRANSRNNSRYYEQYQQKYHHQRQQLAINERNYNNNQWPVDVSDIHNINKQQEQQQSRQMMPQQQDATSLQLKSESEGNYVDDNMRETKQGTLGNKLQSKMRIGNMCKSIQSQQVDEQYMLQDWQRRGIRKHLSTNQHNKLNENNDNISQKSNHNQPNTLSNIIHNANVQHRHTTATGLPVQKSQRRNLTAMNIRQVQSGIMLSTHNSASRLQQQQQQQKEIIQVPVYIIKEVQKRVVQVKEVVVEKQVVKYIEVPVEIAVQIEKIIQVKVQVQKLIEVPIEVQTIKEVVRLVEVPVQVQTIKYVQVEKMIQVQKLIQVPIEIQTVLQVPVEVEILKLIEIPVESQTQIQKQTIKLIQMPIVLHTQTTKLIEIPSTQLIQTVKLIEIPVVNEVPVQIMPQQRLIELPVEIVKQVILETIQEVPYQIIKQMPVQIIKQVPVQIIKQVIKVQLVEVPVEVQVIKQKQVIRVEQHIKLVQVPIQIPLIHETVVQIQKPVYIEIVKEVPIYIETIKEVVKFVQVPVQIEKIVEAPVERIVEVERIVQVIKQVEKIVQIEKSFQRLQQSPAKSYSAQRIPSLLQSPQLQRHFHQAFHTLSRSRRSQSSQLSEGSATNDQQQRMMMYRNDQQFFSLNPTGLLYQNQDNNQQQRQSIIMRLQQNEMRINQQNAYLREKLMVLTESIMEKDEEIERCKKEVRRLKQKVEQQEGYQAQAIQKVAVYEDTLRKQLITRKQLQHKLQLIQLQLLQNQKLCTQYEHQTQTYKQKLQEIQNELTKLNRQVSEKDKQMEYVEGVLRERNAQVIEVNHLCGLMTEQLNNAKANHQQLIQHNHKLQDQIADLKAIIQDFKTDNFQQHYEQIKQKQASLDYHRQRLDKQKIQLQSMYRQQIEGVLAKYSQLVEQNKAQIVELERVIAGLQQQNQMLKGKEKEQQKVIIDALNRENQQLKQDIQNLKQSKANNISLLQQQQIASQQNHQPHMKSFSFSQPQQQSVRNQQPQQQSSKIRIQEIKDINGQQFQNEQVINKLANLVRKYQLEMERKERDIFQMKELVCSYEMAIEELENNNMNNNRVIHNDYHHHHHHIQSPRLPDSTPKPNTQTTSYISTILRKLSLCEQHLSRQRKQKLKLSMRVRQLERSLQQQMTQRNTYRTNVIGQEDDELLEQVVVELETERGRNEELRKEVGFYKQEVSRLRGQEQHVGDHGRLSSSRGFAGGFTANTNSRARSIHNSQTLSNISQLLQDSQTHYLDKQTLLQQLKIYKLQYFKLLNWNKSLKKRIEQLENRGDSCEQHMRIIEMLTVQVRRAREKVKELEEGKTQRIRKGQLYFNKGKHHDKIIHRLNTEFPVQPINLQYPQQQLLHRQRSTNQFTSNYKNPQVMQKSYSENNLLVNFKSQLPKMSKQNSQQQRISQPIILTKRNIDPALDHK